MTKRAAFCLRLTGQLADACIHVSKCRSSCRPQVGHVSLAGLEQLRSWMKAELFLTNFRPVPLTEHAVFQGCVYSKASSCSLQQGPLFVEYVRSSVPAFAHVCLSVCCLLPCQLLQLKPALVHGDTRSNEAAPELVQIKLAYHVLLQSHASTDGGVSCNTCNSLA